VPAKTVLIVEDEFLLAMGLQIVLEQDGWRVIGPAGTVGDALVLLRMELPSVALLDVNLGTEYVTPVAVFLKEHGVPFALATAYHKPEQYAGEILAGIPNVGKPTDDRRLLTTLRQLTADG